MFWERVSEEIYLFTSDRYAMVNSVAILTEVGLVVIDGLPFPDESQQIARFLQMRTGADARLLILTHYHIDHVYGLSAFSSHLDIVAHERCRRRLLEVGEASLQEARQHDPAFDAVTLRFPTVTWDKGEIALQIGDKSLRLLHLPGHTADNIGVLIEDRNVLVSGDAVMAIPIIADGDLEEEIATLRRIKELAPETIVQGHGEVILRGEIQTVLDRYIAYLECVHEKAASVLASGEDRQSIWEIPLEACGLERVPLGVASHRLHVANILSVYDKLKAARDDG